VDKDNLHARRNAIKLKYRSQRSAALIMLIAGGISSWSLWEMHLFGITALVIGGVFVLIYPQQLSDIKYKETTELEELERSRS